MAQPEPPPSELGTDEVIPSRTSVEVSGSENVTLTGLSTGGGDVTVATGAPIFQGDMVGGDKFGGDKVYGDKINQTIYEAPRPKPNLPAHTPHNLPERTTSAERFVGRSQQLEQLQSLLAPEASRAYLTGMGGVGKSELAIQHAYNAFDFNRGGILRLDARQGLDAMALQVVTFFRGTFPDVVLPEDKSPTELLPLCWSQWPSGANPPEPVLLILDDQRGDPGGYGVERKLLEGLPARFRRLITQRETAPATAQAIDLPLLKREAALELLALQAGEGGADRLKAEDQAANSLCDEVGDLPLALVLLGARLSERPDLLLEQLLVDLQAKGPAVKALRQAHPELGAKLGVVEALLISWEPLSEPAKSLALLLSVMAPALIPWELVEACRLPDQEVEEGSAFGDQQAELLRSQFLERSGPGLYQLHPLVRQFLILQCQGRIEGTRLWNNRFAKEIATLCKERIPYNIGLTGVGELNSFQPHIQLVAETLLGNLEDEELLWPFLGLARLCTHSADLPAALIWNRRSVSSCEHRLGSHHPITAMALNALAQSLQELNQHSESEDTFRRAISILEAAGDVNAGNDLAVVIHNLAALLYQTARLGEAGQLVDLSMNLLACSAEDARVPRSEQLLLKSQILYDGGESEQAEVFTRQALTLSQQQFGLDAPETASVMKHLARILNDNNNPSEAKLLMDRVISIDQGHYGVNHPRFAADISDMALILVNCNQLHEAERNFRKAIAIAEACYGSTHPEIATYLNNLGSFLEKTSNLDEAESLLRRALAINENSLGRNHPSCAIVASNLASLLIVAARQKEAEPFLYKALAIDEATYGKNHPKIARRLVPMIRYFYDTLQFELAESFCRRLLGLDERCYGHDSLNVANDHINLALILELDNRRDEAECCMRKALASKEASLGKNHPECAQCLRILARFMQADGLLCVAEKLMRQVLAIDETCFGFSHPDVASDFNTLGQLLWLLDQREEAESMIKRSIQSLLALHREGAGTTHLQDAISDYGSMLIQLGLSPDEIKARIRETIVGPVAG